MRTEKHYFEFVAAAKRQFNKRKAEGDKTEADENKVKKVKTEETVEAEEEEEEENLEENVEENVEENGAAEDNGK